MSAITAELRFGRTRVLPFAWWLPVPALLGLSRLAPATGVGLGFRLIAATAVLLLPGALIAWALGLEGAAPAFTWSLAALFIGMAVMFAVHGSIWLAAAVMGGAGVAAAPAVLLLPGALIARALGSEGVASAFAWTLAALFLGIAVMFAVPYGSIWLAAAVMGGAGLAAAPFAIRRELPRFSPWPLAVLALGLAVGIAYWWVASFGGDSFFHLGRVRKLVDFGSISLRSLDEYRDGGLHPGYAFPLFHGFLALVSKLSGADPDQVVLHGPTALLPLSLLLTYESGVALFRSRWAGLATMLVSFAFLGLAPGHGGSVVSLPLAANASRMLILPALLALVFAYVREPSWSLLASVAAAAGAMTLTHPPHSALVLVVLGGFLVARALMSRRELMPLGAALLAVVVPTGAAALWLRPILHETAAHNPGANELRRAFASYPNELDVFGLHSYRLKPELFGRGGAIAVAALVLLPLAVLARRRLWAAFALGGMLAALAVSLLTFLFPHFADLVSISQARRLVGFSPRMFVIVGGAIVLARLLGPVVLPVALAAGILLQWWVPGSFGSPYRPGAGGPGWLTWAAFAAGGAALFAAALLRRRLPELEREGPLAAAAVVLFLVPVAVHGISRWSQTDTARMPLPPAVERALSERLPERAVVFTDPQTGYALVAALPVYVNATPAVHSSDTRANHPASRDRDAEQFFFHHGPLSVPRRYAASWLLVDRERDGPKPFALPQAWADGRYVLYRLR